MKIEIYSDGSATTAATAGGWGSIIVIDGEVWKELSGHMENATNNDAELSAAVHGLEFVYELIMKDEIPLLTASDTVTLISDSEITLNWANGKYRFKQTDKMPMYERLRACVKAMNVRTEWVKGHSGNPMNERCDRLANLARKQIQEPISGKIDNKAQSSIGTKKGGTASVYYKDVLYILDFDAMIMETYNRDVHGKRGSMIEIRDGKER